MALPSQPARVRAGQCSGVRCSARIGVVYAFNGNTSLYAQRTNASAPVGSGMFRYSGAPVADGTYAFASFSDLTISISFDAGRPVA